MAEGPPPVVLDTTPGEGAVGVDRGQRLQVRYDRPLDPRTVGRAEVRLTSGALEHFLDVRFDPVQRAIITRPFRGQPLEPNVRYTLEVSGARDLDGVEAGPFSLTFETGEAFTEPAPEGTTGWARVQALFDDRCSPGCHDESDGLDLQTLESTARTAVGVAADQTGGTGTVGRLGLSGMARIEPGDPSRSYLIYKMLADPHVWGEPMPPEGPLARAEVALVADWILGGAR